MSFKKLLFPFILLFPFVVTAQQDASLVKWSATRKLQWKDYLAEPDSRSGAAASTSTQTGFEYHIRDNDLTYKITCYFSKEKSWGRYKTDYILSHEQGHFDIAEIHTRKLYEALKGYTLNEKTYKNDLQNMYRKAMRDKELMQQQYDSETDYSRIEAKQKEWLKKIDKMLEETEEFAGY